MGNIRKIHGYECQVCYELYPTREEAKACFDESVKIECDEVKNERPKTKFLKGYECAECLELYKKPEVAKACCKSLGRPSNDYTTYDAIGKKKEQDRKDKEVVQNE
jgi:hypothetical protein